jgi:hypothetical protein
LKEIGFSQTSSKEILSFSRTIRDVGESKVFAKIAEDEAPKRLKK